MENTFKSGFVNIIGLPNAGKSTLLNALSGEKMAITSPKPQTTRQRILSILNSKEYQIIFSDSPGWIEQTSYGLHEAMNKQVLYSGEDADVFILLIDAQYPQQIPLQLLQLIQKAGKPSLVCINKTDIAKPEKVETIRKTLAVLDFAHEVIEISAIKENGVSEVMKFVLENLPEHPAYFPDDILSDKPLRFFIAELIREHIFTLFSDEIPYSCFVIVNACKGVDDQKDLAKIEATIYVNRQSHVSILIGKNGSMIKQLGTESRKSIEKYLNQKVFLDLSVKLKKDWRDNSTFLTKTGILQ